MKNDLKNTAIELCDKYLQGQICKKEIQTFAENLIIEIEELTDDESLIDTIYSWEDEEMFFPITKKNIELWKLRLQTGEDQLEKHNMWNVHIEPQKYICNKYNSDWVPVNKKWTIGVNLSNLGSPINGLRHQKSNGNEGWYIWSGEYKKDEDFFKPLCIKHLLQINPTIIKYLGLNTGFRFQIDQNGYEDVWYDEELIKNEYR